MGECWERFNALAPDRVPARAAAIPIAGTSAPGRDQLPLNNFHLPFMLNVGARVVISDVATQNPIHIPVQMPTQIPIHCS